MNEAKTCFKNVEYTLSTLLKYVEIGDIGLPDMQRPFVWSKAKVRDLFDSMYRGFPVGYFLFWSNREIADAKRIGPPRDSQHTPSLLIVDGQQRLTSLYAVFCGKKVLDNDFREQSIEIAFRPRDGRFEVADATTQKDPEWIPNISQVLSGETSLLRFSNNFITRLRGKGDLSPEDEKDIETSLSRLAGLDGFPFTALEILPQVDVEQVSEIFVRINSEGVKLKQADFILTLLSVFWEDGRRELEAFCQQARQLPSTTLRASSFNYFIQPDPGQMVRVTVAYGFGRARLKSVYQIIRGKDLATGVYSAEKRDEQLRIFQEAQQQVLELTSWHQFLACLKGAGYRSGEMISSENALLYSYVFYLFGRVKYGAAEHMLQRLIGRWFFFVSLTGRYTGSYETIMDGDLSRLKNVSDFSGLSDVLETIMAQELTNDFWRITLPGSLESSSARNPELFAYVAAQNKLSAPVLFSRKKIPEMLDPGMKMKRKALERHHLFPKAWLDKHVGSETKLINQQANYALLEWPDNADVADENPADYVPRLRKKGKFSSGEWALMLEMHGLPDGWENMPY